MNITESAVITDDMTIPLSGISGIQIKRDASNDVLGGVFSLVVLGEVVRVLNADGTWGWKHLALPGLAFAAFNLLLNNYQLVVSFGGVERVVMKRQPKVTVENAKAQLTDAISRATGKSVIVDVN